MDHRQQRADQLKRQMTIDCENCCGLCCVALYCARSEGFPADKPAGVPCQHLQRDFRCAIHQKLAQKKYTGCMAFDCMGAGQRATALAGGLPAGRAEQERLSAAFLQLWQLYQVCWYLAEASILPAAQPLWEQLDRALDELCRLVSLPLLPLLQVDVERCRTDANQLLKRAVAMACKKTDGKYPGIYLGRDLRRRTLRERDLSMALLIAADLRGCDLSGTSLLGADLRDCDLRGADLHSSLFLLQGQLNAARGDSSTRLPAGLCRPVSWQ